MTMKIFISFLQAEICYHALWHLKIDILYELNDTSLPVGCENVHELKNKTLPVACEDVNELNDKTLVIWMFMK